MIHKVTRGFEMEYYVISVIKCVYSLPKIHFKLRKCMILSGPGFAAESDLQCEDLDVEVAGPSELL